MGARSAGGALVSEQTESFVGLLSNREKCDWNELLRLGEVM